MVGQSPPPNAPQFMKALNCSLPGVCETTPENSILDFGQNQCVGGNQPFRFNMGDRNKQNSDHEPDLANLGALSPMMQNMMGGNRRPAGYADNSYSGGNNGSGSSGSGGGGSGGGGNTGPDSLCTKKDGGSVQTKVDPKTNESWCDVIYNTITKDPYSESCNPSTKDLAGQMAVREIKEMDQFCPGWNTIKANPEKRAVFLMNFIAAIVHQESSWKPDTVGDKERGMEKASKGLCQLTASSDYSKGCGCNEMRSEADTFDPVKNLKCCTHMVVKAMVEDGTVGRGVGGKKHNPDPVRGLAKSFGPFQTGRPERKTIMDKTRAYCEKTLGAGAAAPAAGAHDAESAD